MRHANKGREVRRLSCPGKRERDAPARSTATSPPGRRCPELAESGGLSLWKSKASQSGRGWRRAGCRRLNEQPFHFSGQRRAAYGFEYANISLRSEDIVSDDMKMFFPIIMLGPLSGPTLRDAHPRLPQNSLTSAAILHRFPERLNA